MHDLREHSFSPENRFPEQVGAVVHEYMEFEQWGEVEVTGKILVPRDHLLHFAVLEVSYSMVRSYNVWHIIRLWHRIYMFSLDSEAINESVASVARYIEKKHGVGRPLEPRSLVEATRLSEGGRCARRLDRHRLVAVRSAVARWKRGVKG